jgi:hypothetical protein
MPILNVAGRGVAKNNAFAGLKFFVLYFDILEVGVAIFSCVKSSDLHNPPFVEKSVAKSNRCDSWTIV